VTWYDDTDTQQSLPGGSSLSATFTKVNSALASADFVNNKNGNGPLIAFASSATQWGTLTAASSAWGGANAGLYGGVYGSTSSSTTTYNIALPTTITDALSYGSGASAANFFGSITTAQLEAQSGVDIYFNPNLWTTISGTSMIENCFWNGVPDLTTGPFLDNPSDKSLHCYAAPAASGSATRLRSVYVGANVSSLTGLTSSGSSSYWTFFFEGFLNLITYAGTSIKADKNVDDVYVIGFLNDGTVLNSTSNGASGPNTTVTDAGDLGASGGQLSSVTLGQSFFFNQYRLAPMVSSAGVSTIYQSIKFWVSGWNDEASVSDDSSVMLIRVRGLLVSGTDTTPSSNNLALFFRKPTSGFNPVGPAIHDNNVDNQFRCWTSSLITCH